MKRNFLIFSGVLLASSSFAAISDQAWQAISSVAPELKNERVRKACQNYGEFKILQENALEEIDAANDPANRWNRRNLVSAARQAQKAAESASSARFME